MKLRLLVICALLTGSLQAQVTYERLLHANQEPQNWLTYSGGYASQPLQPLTQINRDNVKDLQLKWVYHPTVTGGREDGEHASCGGWRVVCGEPDGSGGARRRHRPAVLETLASV